AAAARQGAGGAALAGPLPIRPFSDGSPGEAAAARQGAEGAAPCEVPSSSDDEALMDLVPRLEHKGGEGSHGADAVGLDDAPPGSGAHVPGRIRHDPEIHTGGLGRYMFTFGSGGSRVSFQVTVRMAGDREAAARICRLCFASFEGGATKGEVLAYRLALYRRFCGDCAPGAPCGRHCEGPPPGCAGAHRGPPAAAGAAARCLAPRGVEPPRPGVAVEDLDLNNSFCEVCQKGGRLLLCDQCPRAFHMRCVQRFVDKESLAQSSSWSCPICRHGPDALNPHAQLSPQESMERAMRDAARRAGEQRRQSARRRDLLLAGRWELVELFATRGAAARIGRLAASGCAAAEPEIGSVVRLASAASAQEQAGAEVAQEGGAAEHVVLAQVGTAGYLVAALGSGAELRTEGRLLLPPEPGRQAQPPDLLRFARGALVSEDTRLKDYQVEGVNWLIRAYHNRCGGILADDMGLGKTIQTLVAMSYLRASGAASGPFLVVAPLSCTWNWIREAARFVPHLSVARVFGSSQEKKHSLDDDALWYGARDIVVTTYESLASTEDFLRRHLWAAVVLDEAHRAKNQAGSARAVLDGLRSAGRLLLTGTPLQNSMQELLALLRFLWPDVFPKESEAFERAVRLRDVDLGDVVATGSTADVDAPVVAKIRDLLDAVMIRRRKEDVIALPPKVRWDVWLPLSPEQTTWYKTLLRCRARVQERGGVRALRKLVVWLRVLGCLPSCLAASQDDRQRLLDCGAAGEAALAALRPGMPMSDELVAQSSKLSFLDKLLGHLHAQNMSLCPRWRRAFEERCGGRPAGEGPAQAAAAWIARAAASGLFLQEMRPWRGEGGSGAAGAQAGDGVTPRPHKVLIFSQILLPSASWWHISLQKAASARQNEKKVLIFSQFHACLDVLQAFCGWRGWRSLRLDGSTPRVLRDLDIRDFHNEDEDYFVYLIGTRAGGLGINLTGANHVVLFDSDYNPHADCQAVDRAHRIGQSRPVNVYRLIQEWGVEERLAGMQEQKLCIEECVTHGGPAGDARDRAADHGGTRNREELTLLLRYGARSLQGSCGEDLSGWSLQGLLAEEDDLPDGSDAEAAGCAPAAERAESEECGALGGLASEGARGRGALARSQDVVKTTASGRVVREARVFNAAAESPRRRCAPRAPLRHEARCFVCRGGARGGGAAASPSGCSRPDRLCELCPKAYHAECLPASPGSAVGGRWVCGWHHCAGCGRKASLCGGMLVHCVGCPAAFCIDCFPADFRRVHQPEEFWAGLRDRGWQVSAASMALFRCNSCRAREEHGRRRGMCVEELLDEQGRHRRATEEELQVLVAAKRRKEDQESRRCMRQLILEHERTKLKADLRQARRDLLRAAEGLWPRLFRQRWTAACADPEALVAAALARSPSKKRVASLRQLKAEAAALAEPVALCGNCGVPGHAAAGCLLPAERTTDQLCGLCQGGGHERMQCPQLSAEQQAEYQARLGRLRRLSTVLAAEEPIDEPDDPVGLDESESLMVMWNQTQQRVEQRLRAALQ
ncbi:unnamed protein product, partial [Prorocentrum cordatum]